MNMKVKRCCEKRRKRRVASVIEAKASRKHAKRDAGNKRKRGPGRRGVQNGNRTSEVLWGVFSVKCSGLERPEMSHNLIIPLQ